MKILLFGLLIFSQSFLCFAQEIEESEFIIKNKSDYSNDFLKCLQKIKGQNFTLIDSLFIINSVDTVIFPIFSNELIKYENVKGNWVLKFKQINFSTIEYSISSTDLSQDFDGLATINCSFYLGCESDEDEDGELYFSDEYFDYCADIFLSIRIGEKYCKVNIGNIGSPMLKQSSI